MKQAAGRRFKTWVKLQQLDKPVRDFDSTPAAWQTIWTGRVSLTPVRSGEQLEGNHLEFTAVHQIKMRHSPDFTLAVDMRFLLDDESITRDEDKRKLYVIDNHERKRFWFAKCIESQ